jgi:hypothetical protein
VFVLAFSFTLVLAEELKGRITKVDAKGLLGSHINPGVSPRTRSASMGPTASF